MSKKLDLNEREENVIYIDAHEFNNKQDFSRGAGILKYFEEFKKSNRVFAKQFKEYGDHNIETKKYLPVGDVLHNDVCCEIKEYDSNDLINSMYSGRLQRQSHELYQLKNKNLYDKPLNDCRIIIVADADGYNHIHNEPGLYKGFLKLSGETPVNFVNYTKSPKYLGNWYVNLADSLFYLFGMNGEQIGRQSTIAITSQTNPAVNCLMSLDVFNRGECVAICNSEGLLSWADVFDWLHEDVSHIHSVFVKHSSARKAKNAVIKIFSRRVMREVLD